jgi:glycosyltransferase involved in cell wall biosynthesis
MPEFDRESGSRRVFDLIAHLRDAGWAVSFAAENPAGARYKRILQQRGVAVYGGFGERLSEAMCLGQFDLGILVHWYTAEELLPRLRAASPGTRIAVDSIDLHFLRNARRLLRPLGRSPGVVDNAFGSELVRELNVLAAADAVFAVSEKEAALVNDFVGDPRLAHVVPDTERMEPSTHRFAARRGVLFVGNFRHPPNVEAAEFLCTEVVPRIDPELLARHPVYVVGTDLDAKGVRRFANASPHIRMVGWVPSLVPYFHRARVAVAPLLHGAGTKRKVLQAIMAGTPTVTTPVGAEGFDVTDEKHVLIATDADGFARAVDRLLTDGRLWSRLARNGRKALEPLYGPEPAQKAFLRAVKGTLAREPKKADLTDDELTALAPVKAAGYIRLVERIRALVANAIPPGSRVAVVSKGDARLLELPGSECCHFLQDDKGEYAGYHPRDSEAAITALEQLRARGVKYLLLPATALWWLEHYSEFGAYLVHNYSRVVDQPNTCVIYALSNNGAQAASGGGDASQ